MHFTMSHTTSLLCVSYLDHLSQIVTNIREIILQTTRVFFRRAWWKEVGVNLSIAIEMVVGVTVQIKIIAITLITTYQALPIIEG